MTSPTTSHFTPVALNHASRLINHGPTVLVTSAHAGRRNIMAAAWSMPVEFTPPRIAIVIDKSTYTRELIAASGAFGICLPGTALAGLTYAVGTTSWRDEDKLARHGIQTQPGPVLGVPVMQQGCAAWLECRLIPERHTEDAYDTCFAEVVAAAADAASLPMAAGIFATTTPSCRPFTTWGRGSLCARVGWCRGRRERAAQLMQPGFNATCRD